MQARERRVRPWDREHEREHQHRIDLQLFVGMLGECGEQQLLVAPQLRWPTFHVGRSLLGAVGLGSWRRGKRLVGRNCGQRGIAELDSENRREVRVVAELTSARIDACADARDLGEQDARVDLPQR